jgi:hypothetical protein
MGAAVTHAAVRAGVQPAARAVLRAIGRALPLLFSGRLLGRLALWTLGAFVAWTLIGIFAFDPATRAIEALVGSTSTMAHALAGLFVFLTLVAAAIVTALVAVATLAMPAIVSLVSNRYYPHLEQRHGGRWHGSLRNAVFTLLLFVPLWLVALLLLGLPPLYLAVSWCLNGWLNQRLFRYDALAEHADPAELVEIPREIRGRLLALGVVFAPLTLIPIVNLAVPLFAGIAFACLCLDALAHRREALAR